MEMSFLLNALKTGTRTGSFSKWCMQHEALGSYCFIGKYTILKRPLL